MRPIRRQSGKKVDELSRWLKGLDFFLLSYDWWANDIANENVKYTMKKNSSITVEVQRFSHWFRLHRTMSYVLRFSRNIKCKIVVEIQTGTITGGGLCCAELQLYRQAQLTAFPDEIRWNMANRKAIHLEIASSLSTDSCFMCIRNCMSRRGQPKKM